MFIKRILFSGLVLTGAIFMFIDVTGAQSIQSLPFSIGVYVNAYTLTILPSEGSGTTLPATGVHTFSNNSNVVISATPSVGWTFAHWILDGSIKDVSSYPLTVNMNLEHTLKAVFVVMPPSGGGGGGRPPLPSLPITTPIKPVTELREVIVEITKLREDDRLEEPEKRELDKLKRKLNDLDKQPSLLPVYEEKIEQLRNQIEMITMLKPKPELKPEPELKPKPELELEPELKPEPEPKPKPELELEPELKPEPEPKPKPELELESMLKSESNDNINLEPVIHLMSSILNEEPVASEFASIITPELISSLSAELKEVIDEITPLLEDDRLGEPEKLELVRLLEKLKNLEKKPYLLPIYKGKMERLLKITEKIKVFYLKPESIPNANFRASIFLIASTFNEELRGVPEYKGDFNPWLVVFLLSIIAVELEIILLDKHVYENVDAVVSV